MMPGHMRIAHGPAQLRHRLARGCQWGGTALQAPADAFAAIDTAGNAKISLRRLSVCAMRDAKQYDLLRRKR